MADGHDQTGVSPEVAALLQQLEKARGDGDLSRKIRRQLRANGYSLRGAKGGTPASAATGEVSEKRREKKDRERSSLVQAPPMRLEGKPTGPMAEDRVEALCQLIERSWEGIHRLTTPPDDVYGYGFQLNAATPHQQIIDKFNGRWPNVMPSWYAITGTPNGVRLLSIGPCPSVLG